MELTRKIEIRSLAVIIALLLCSCNEQKYFFKTNHIQTVKPKTNTEIGDTRITYDTILNFKPKNGFWGKMKEKESYIVIIPSKNEDILKTSFKIDTIAILKLPENPNAEIELRQAIDVLKNKYFFPDIVLDTFPFSRIKFFDTKPVFQTLTIPIRIRPALKSASLKDSFPSQVETGVNLGIAFGWKFQLNYYEVSPSLFSQKGNKMSITPGIFYNIGSADLSTKNTRNPVISIERQALTHTFGGFAMVGFNSVNFGYACGWDFATGQGNKSWLYQGKFWYGIALSLDLIK
jgi:hypothetical protein